MADKLQPRNFFKCSTLTSPTCRKQNEQNRTSESTRILRSTADETFSLRVERTRLTPVLLYHNNYSAITNLVRHLAHAIFPSGSPGELKRNKKRISARNPDIHRESSPVRISLVRHRKCNSNSLSLLRAHTRTFYNKIHGLVRKSHCTLPIGAARFFLALLARARERKVPTVRPAGPIHAHRIARAEPRNSLFRSRGDSARARYKRIFYDSYSCRQYRRGFAVCLYNTAKEPPEEVPPKELGRSDILVSTPETCMTRSMRQYR